jgi:hypothetical protein
MKLSRIAFALLAGLLAFLPGTTRAADTPAGNWRLTFPVETARGEVTLNILVMFSEADGKWAGDFLDVTPPIGVEPSVEVNIKDDAVRFSIKFGENNWSFDGKLMAGAKRIKGSVDLGGQIILSEMVKSSVKSLTKDKFAVARDTLDSADGGAEFFNSLFAVLSQAGAKKLKAEDIRNYADKAAKLAEGYGPRWQRTVAFRIAEVLADQADYAAIAVEQARQGERLVGRGDEVSVQLATLESLARILRKAKKDADAKEVEGRIAKLEPRDYADYLKGAVTFATEEFKGRKGKSDRAVLIELFTGAENPSANSADTNLLALAKTYKPTDVIVLQYHMHVPGPDPMAIPDANTRAGFYVKSDDDRVSPLLVLAGKPDLGPKVPPKAAPKGPKAAQAKFAGYKETIAELLEKPAGVKLSATATLKGDEIAIKANVSDLEKPGDKIVLRLALVEEKIRYSGGNNIRYHHQVVRSLPGGAKGFVLTKKASEQLFSVKLSEVKTEINKGLDEFVAEVKKQGADFNFPERPMAFKNLKLVAFVQDDESKEILHAIQVDVEEAK